MKKLFCLLLALFLFTACQSSNTSSNEVYCKEQTTKMYNAIEQGKPETVMNLVSKKYKDATGLYSFETAMAKLLEQYNANDETLKAFNSLCETITKNAVKSYTIESYKESNKMCYVYVKVTGVNFKKIYPEDYSDQFPKYFTKFKENNATYNDYLEIYDEEVANQKILEDACNDYFASIQNDFEKTDISEYLVRVVFKKIEGKYQIYKTEVQI